MVRDRRQERRKMDVDPGRWACHGGWDCRMEDSAKLLFGRLCGGLEKGIGDLEDSRPRQDNLDVKSGSQAVFAMRQWPRHLDTGRAQEQEAALSTRRWSDASGRRVRVARE